MFGVHYWQFLHFAPFAGTAAEESFFIADILIDFRSLLLAGPNPGDG